MNVEDKGAVMREMYRVLKPGGQFALQSQIRMGPGEATYPLPWASGPDSSFLASTDEFRAMAEAAGFTVTAWQDGGAAAPPPPVAPPAGLNFSVIMKFQNFDELMLNARAAAEQGILSIAVGVLTK